MVAVAGCTVTSKKVTSVGTASTVGASAAPRSGVASSAAGSGSLPKAEFVSKMNAVCVDFNTRMQALPLPSGIDDYDHVADNLTGNLTLFPQYYQQASALVDRSEDKATLTSNWLTVEKSDFDAFEPLARKLVTDANARDRAKVDADGKALDKVPDHTDSIAAFMSGYGLGSCAVMERS